LDVFEGGGKIHEYQSHLLFFSGKIMFVPVFTLNLNQKLLPGKITIGEFDGEHPSLVAATTGERILVHNPYQKLTGNYKRQCVVVTVICLARSAIMLASWRLH
jgi:hypothetical protein